MAANGFQHLTLDERRSLFWMREARLGVTEMAARLGRHRSTIYRELGRNRFRDPDASRDSRRNMSGYYPVTAQDAARARRRRLAKLARHEELLAHVVDRLRAGWSPQQIAGRLRQEAEADGKDSKWLCHETIYRHVYGPHGRAEQLYLRLPRARRRRGTRHGRRPRGHRIPLERGIACRPADVATRESFGHWEGDLLMFTKSAGNANVTTLVERRSRFLVLLPNPDRRPAGMAERIQAALGSMAQDLRQARRTATKPSTGPPTATAGLRCCRADAEPALRRIATSVPVLSAEIWLGAHHENQLVPCVRTVLGCIAEVVRGRAAVLNPPQAKYSYA